MLRGGRDLASPPVSADWKEQSEVKIWKPQKFRKVSFFRFFKVLFAPLRLKMSLSFQIFLCHITDPGEASNSGKWRREDNQGES